MCTHFVSNSMLSLYCRDVGCRKQTFFENRELGNWSVYALDIAHYMQPFCHFVHCLVRTGQYFNSWVIGTRQFLYKNTRSILFVCLRYRYCTSHAAILSPVQCAVLSLQCKSSAAVIIWISKIVYENLCQELFFYVLVSAESVHLPEFDVWAWMPIGLYFDLICFGLSAQVPVHLPEPGVWDWRPGGRFRPQDLPLRGELQGNVSTH
jgi:hypothetical protein